MELTPTGANPPRVFTCGLVARLKIANEAARIARALGLRIIDQEEMPPDNGRPILRLVLNGHDREQLLRHCDASTCHANGRITGEFHGVRVVVEDGSNMNPRAKGRIEFLYHDGSDHAQAVAGDPA